MSDGLWELVEDHLRSYRQNFRIGCLFRQSNNEFFMRQIHLLV